MPLRWHLITFTSVFSVFASVSGNKKDPSHEPRVFKISVEPERISERQRLQSLFDHEVG
jgi:hypothetical protein